MTVMNLDAIGDMDFLFRNHLKMHILKGLELVCVKRTHHGSQGSAVNYDQIVPAALYPMCMHLVVLPMLVACEHYADIITEMK